MKTDQFTTSSDLFNPSMSVLDCLNPIKTKILELFTKHSHWKMNNTVIFIKIVWTTCIFCYRLLVIVWRWISCFVHGNRHCGRGLMPFWKYSEWIQFQCHSTDVKYSEWIYFRVVKASCCWRYHICKTVRSKCVLCCREYSDCSNWPHHLLLYCKKWHPSAAQCVRPVSRHPADGEHCFQQPTPCTHRIGPLLAYLVRTTFWCIVFHSLSPRDTKSRYNVIVSVLKFN